MRSSRDTPRRLMAPPFLALYVFVASMGRLAAMQVEAGAEANRKAGLDSKVAVASSRTLEIPSWKLNMRYDPSKLIQEQPEVEDAADNIPDEGGFLNANQVMYRLGAGGGTPTLPPRAFGSTPAQDTGRCPLLKLPDLVILEATEESYGGQRGRWTSQGRINMASWLENYFGVSWMTVFVKSADGKLAAKAEPINEDQLYERYKFELPTAKSSSKGADAASSSAQVVTFSVTDCEDSLLFVLRLQKGAPGVIDIYDRLSNLIAHTLSDGKVLRHQFVDPNGYLLAVAESPGLQFNYTRPAEPPEGQKARIQPYVMQVMEGGYKGSSKLLNDEFRWVLATAVQARAVTDAYGTWTPTVRPLGIAMVVVFILVFLLIIGCCTHCLFRLVYPEWLSRGSKGRAMNPYMYSGM
eukprot:TRINITY_DN32437_c0_g1_i1.p1 TRINITY_DN32437_c0_g1~~TRINITY_DN32437_c0_g1_i1.p1  ORF type:complete len:409 (-),score=66.56 TRINITY_DN32437_c0_g1_i1:37-1263(-)